ncbi:MAG: hypothetical protein U5L96_07450 [Owenweeksia sp.]|nr:hypothetical protein [Owenweeksia sp.]
MIHAPLQSCLRGKSTWPIPVLYLVGCEHPFATLTYEGHFQMLSHGIFDFRNINLWLLVLAAAIKTVMENHFEFFRKNIVGVNTKIQTPFKSSQKLSYADLALQVAVYYGPIEDRLREEIFPMVANTHTDTRSYLVLSMTDAQPPRAQQSIKGHVGASTSDVLLTCSSAYDLGWPNKFQRKTGA